MIFRTKKILVGKQSSEGSYETAQMCSLIRAFAACMYIDFDKDTEQKFRPLTHWIPVHVSKIRTILLCAGLYESHHESDSDQPA